MALKEKGKTAKSHPKAGPKKRRAKAEEAAILEAIEEHGKRGIRAARKSSKVNSFRYKDPAVEHAKRKRLDAYLREMERVFGLREPRHENEFLAFFETLKADEQPFAVKLFQMTCEHDKTEVVASRTSITSDKDSRHIACVRCGLLRKEDTSKKHMRAAEWANYCPEGYDMFDWADLLMPDKSMWRFIHDEVLAEQVEGSMTEDEEVAA